MKKYPQTINKVNNQKGFSFIELLVVISVFGILSVIVISGFSGYDQKIKFEQLALNIAIAIRQAQNFGTSSVDYVLRDFNPDDIDNINPIGIRFTYDSGLSAFKPELTLFKDVNKGGGNSLMYDEFYDSKIDTVIIPGITKISNICEEVATNICSSYGKSLTLFFKRPYPEPYLEGLLNDSLIGSGYSLLPAQLLSYPLRIELFDEAQNVLWMIRIEPTGLISVSPLKK